MNEDETLDPDSQEDINTVDQPPSDQLGSDQFVGPYKILRQMGQGGMGTVYLGTRTDQDFKRLFAIKVIRKGMDTEAIINRFRTERRILAALDHTNIARLLDGGTTTEGLPYFVMEYIEGLPLTKYCDSQRLKTQERLNIFLEICSAVQYAHRNLIVHRDLKPGNILVTSAGVPKLLDFGIAKILNPEFISTEFQPTATEFPIMTPHYASPEQSRGEAITTASDVYSLGVILYELLTGSRPYNFTGANYQEIQKVICEQEPEKPSSLIGSGNDTNKITTLTGSTSEKLQKELQGDLDNIILMALRKEPNRRYSSVEAMMADLQNYLESRPVLARKSTWSYRAGKYVKRNTAAVIAASVVSLLLIAFAITLSIDNARILQQRNEAIQAKQKAQEEEKKAETERLKAEQVTDFLMKLFESNDPDQTKGATLTARQILDAGAERIRKQLKNQPEIQADLMDKIGLIYATELGLNADAKPLLQQSLEIRQKLFGQDHLAVAESLHHLGGLITQQGDYNEGERLLQQSLVIMRKHLPAESQEIADALSTLAMISFMQGNFAEAERSDTQSLAIYRKLKNEDRIAGELMNICSARMLMNRREGIETEMHEILAIHQKLYGNENTNIAMDLHNLGSVLYYEGNLVEAEKILRQAATMQAKLVGEKDWATAYYRGTLAGVLNAEGKHNEAADLLMNVLAIDKMKGNNPEYLATHEAMLAEVFLDQGHVDAAIKSARQALSVIAAQEGDDPSEKIAMGILGAAFTKQHKFVEAEPLLLKSYDFLAKEEKGIEMVKAEKRLVALYDAWQKPELASKYRKNQQ